MDVKVLPVKCKQRSHENHAAKSATRINKFIATICLALSMSTTRPSSLPSANRISFRKNNVAWLGQLAPSVSLWQRLCLRSPPMDNAGHIVHRSQINGLRWTRFSCIQLNAGFVSIKNLFR
ncbi:unnamed protein product [Soboliphyme baturini]|uniref:Uncharacterized protein n=1 Tax=Soboliphyme baturini TaxID=241478 RepID=A0A183IK95_9BILA|nr:unnamed protein product [Soboliphyme baturini]